MTKSRLYEMAKIEGLEALYKAKTTYFNKRSNLVEYIHKYNWSDEIRVSHPEFSDFAVMCIGINKNGVPFIGKALKEGDKEEGYFYFQCGLNENKTLEDMKHPENLYK